MALTPALVALAVLVCGSAAQVPAAPPARGRPAVSGPAGARAHPAGAAASPVTVAPPPVGGPAALARLYGDEIATSAQGEPVLAVGLQQGDREVRLRAGGPTWLSACRAGRCQSHRLAAGSRIAVRLGTARPARHVHEVDLGSTSPAGLRARVATWRREGVGAIGVTRGRVLRVGGAALDLREAHAVVPAGGAAAAEALAAALRRQGHGARARRRRVGLPHGTLRIYVDGGLLALADDDVALRPLSDAGATAVEGVRYGQGYPWAGQERRRYAGTVHVGLDPRGRLAVVNVIGSEALLAGVVPAEMYASAPAAALEAQAVAARNVLLAHLGHRHRDAPFHVCADQHCQVYAGRNRAHPASDRAVRATAGQVLFAGGTVLPAVYSASCGGFTEANDAAWGEAPAAALTSRSDLVAAPREAAPRGETAIAAFVRAAPATYCAAGAPPGHGQRWRVRLGPEALAAVAARAPEIGTLTDMEVRHRGPGGRVVALRLVGTRGSRTVRHELAVRQVLGNLRSAAFTLTHERGKSGALAAVEVIGRGWGHGVGLCQLGAIGRARAGQDAVAILTHYYRGARLRSLWR